MMLLRMRRKKLLSSLLLPLPLTLHRTSLEHLAYRCFSASAAQTSPRKPHFMVDYLVKSLGFSLEKAIKSSKPIAYLKSPARPDSVIRFLKMHGFDDTRIKYLVSTSPALLCCSVDKTLGPNMNTLIDMGFSGLSLQQFLKSNPNALILHSIVPRIGFWRTLLGNNQRSLQKAFKNNRGLINHDVTAVIAPRITLLKSYGLSDQQIERIVILGVLITRNLASIEALLKQTLEFGFRCSSMMFAYGLFALSNHRREAFKAKIELLRSYGWSETQFISAFRKAPNFTGLSEANIGAKMEFLVERAGCAPSYIALNPILLTYSLEKRLMPRHHVLQILKAKEVVRTLPELTTLMIYTEKVFVEKFILGYKEEAPKLHESYIAACAGNVRIEPMSKGILVKRGE